MNNRFTCFIALGFALGAASALAQTYPTKPVRIIVPFPAACAADIMARSIGQELTKVWGQQVQKLMVARAAVLHPSAPAEFAATITSDIAKWGKVARTAGIRIE